MRRSVVLLISPLTVITMLANASVAIGGSSGEPTVDVEFQEIPHCQVSVADLCLAGHDRNGTNQDLGDDSVYVYQSVSKATLRLPSEPTNTLPDQIHVDARRVAVESPVFPAVRDTGWKVNESRPDAAKPFIWVQQPRNGTILILVLPLGSLLNDENLPTLTAGIPILYNWFGATNYTHVAPLQDDMWQPRGSDVNIDGAFNGTFVEDGCQHPFGIPVEATVPGTCGFVGARMTETNAFLKNSLPNVVCCAATPRADVLFDGGGHKSMGPDHRTSVDGGRSEAKAGQTTVHGRSKPVSALNWHPPSATLPSQENGRSDVESSGQTGLVPNAPAVWDEIVMVVLGLVFLGFGLLALYHRISNARLLENANRRRILEILSAEPGLTTHELALRVALNYRTVAGHLRRMEQAGIVASTREGRKRYFANHGALQKRTMALMAKRSPAVRAILSNLLEGPATALQIASSTGSKVPTISRHVLRLAKMGAIQKEKRGRQHALALADSWRLAVIEFLERTRV